MAANTESLIFAGCNLMRFKLKMDSNIDRPLISEWRRKVFNVVNSVIHPTCRLTVCAVKRLSMTAGLVVLLLPCFMLSARGEEPIYTVDFRLMALPPIEGYQRDSLNGEAEEDGLDGEAEEDGLDGENHTIHDVLYQNGDNTEKISTIPYLTQTPSYTYRGPSPLVFFREISTGDGKKERKVLAQVDITAGQSHILILALPRKENARTGFMSHSLSDDLDSFPFNSFRIINFSNSQIACLIDGKKQVVEARGEGLTVLPIKEPKMVALKMASLNAESGKSQTISSTAVPFFGISRVLCLILPDRSTKGETARPVLILDLGPENAEQESEEPADFGDMPSNG